LPERAWSGALPRGAREKDRGVSQKGGTLGAEGRQREKGLRKAVKEKKSRGLGRFKREKMGDGKNWK